MTMNFLLNQTLWIWMTALFGIGVSGMGIFFFILFKRTHVYVELKAFFSNTPIGIFFQDNKFAEWRPITPINGVIYDNIYGPFIVSTTYVDKKTKNIIIAFDVDMDGDRTTNIKALVEEFRNITNNEKSISQLRNLISSGLIENNNNIKNVTSHIKYGDLKNLFFTSGPHSIKSKIEKQVAQRIVQMANINPMQAIIVFGGIFGIIILGAIMLKTAGGV